MPWGGGKERRGVCTSRSRDACEEAGERHPQGLKWQHRDCFEEENRGKKQKPEGDVKRETHNVLGNTAPRTTRYRRRPHDQATRVVCCQRRACIPGWCWVCKHGRASCCLFGSSIGRANSPLVRPRTCSRVGRRAAGPGLDWGVAPNPRRRLAGVECLICRQRRRRAAEKVGYRLLSRPGWGPEASARSALDCAQPVFLLRGHRRSGL